MNPKLRLAWLKCVWQLVQRYFGRGLLSQPAGSYGKIKLEDLQEFAAALKMASDCIQAFWAVGGRTGISIVAIRDCFFVLQ